MPFFLQQASFTQEAVAKLLAHPEDRAEAVRGPIEKLGGKIHTSFVAFGEYDLVTILEMPDNISAAALAMAFAGGGAIKSIHTTPLMTIAEGVEAMKKAGTCGYKSLVSDAAAAAHA
ncbi:MAG TPA: GYD domain-containing protein [Candidatus Acidoferrum sp.]|jgi:uncharacterized protein with GYD domain|nr:GYD domain-containing protein [Candidatus Acidoferrum sp.]